ncbi:double-stranded RNA-specific editase 1 isoform X2 [Cimex lectularius]|uniref:Adenosine deaminase acting on RNA n=1 Tax=Cimex lectularius TaxID=79782 RepID=A0A8I6R852_CIMLE|nr:double-stranded RNA-specific editase 1 isoform X2 [Cimex lectularius]
MATKGASMVFNKHINDSNHFYDTPVYPSIMPQLKEEAGENKVSESPPNSSHDQRKDSNKLRRSRSPGARKNGFSELEPKAKKMRKNGSHTPLAILNELRSGLQYKIVSSDGPPHSPNFLASVEVDGIVFSGSANAKKQAKQRAAEAALLTLCPSLLTPADNIDFTKDSASHDKTPAQLLPKKLKMETLIAKAMSGAVNPVMALNEFIPGLKYECLIENSQKFVSPFVFGVTVDNTTFQGSGNSKKNAKAAAARSVLLTKFSHLCTSALNETPPFGQNNFAQNGPMSLQPIAANKIVEIVLEHYYDLMANHQDYAKRKVLAGVLMSTEEDLSDIQMISLGTGTKCVGGEHISVKGAVLNDCHAEIIARRGLIRFFYKQLLLHTDPATAESSIFERSDTSGFRLKPQFKFHLYISTSPCGDARIFSPHDSDSQNEEAVDRHPNRQSRGQLRTKIESGEGTIPVKSANSIQTWDGVMQGERLLTMSCSDKIAKWNVVGLQGSLLSHFLEPVYLHSLVVGSLFHPSHLRRALYQRIENTLVGLPPPFRLNKLKLNTTSSPEARHIGKAPSHSVNWIIDDGPIEVVNTMTGKCISGSVSRLCKQKFYHLFRTLVDFQLPTRSGVADMPDIYLDAKYAEVTYREAKIQMVQAFQKANLGTWMKKPIEQDQFELDGTVNPQLNL